MKTYSSKKISCEEGGAIEIFSSGTLIIRSKAYEILAKLTLTKFVAEKWYK